MFVVAILAVCILLLAFWYSTTPRGYEIRKSFVDSITQTDSTQPDSDEDGLEDWEEELFKTNSLDSDSDGDGVPDGDQFASYKNINYVQPSDSILNYINSVGDTLAGQENPIEDLTLEPTFYPDKYTVSDVIHVEVSTTTMFTYVATLLIELSEHDELYTESPLEIISHWLDTQDESDLETLRQISVVDKNFSATLMKMEVPTFFIEFHLVIANSFYLGALSLDDVKITTIDPTAGFFAAANYANYTSRRSNAIFELTKLLNI